MYTLSSEVSLLSVFSVVKKYIRQILLLGLIFSLVLVAANDKIIPERYEASVLIKINFAQWVETVYRITTQPNAAVTPLEFSQTELLARTNIEEALKNLKIVKEVKDSNILNRKLASSGFFKKVQTLEDAVSDIQPSILIQSENPTSELLRIRLRDKNPEFAKEFVTNLINSYLVLRKEQMLNASTENIKTIEKQLEVIESKLNATEKELLDFSKTRTGSDISLASFGTASQTLQDTKASIKDLEIRQRALETALKTEPQFLPDRLGTNPSTEEQIRQRSIQLVDLESRYTSNFPEVVSLRESIKALKALPKEVYTVPNPEYQRLRLELINVTSTLSRSNFLKDALEKTVKSGQPIVASSFISSKTLLIESLNTEKVALQTKLVNEQIRKDAITDNVLSLINIVDKASAKSLLFQNRFVLMLGAVVLSLLIALMIYWIKAYLLLNQLQAVYGPLLLLPKKLPIKYLKNKNNEVVFSLPKTSTALVNINDNVTVDDNVAIQLELKQATRMSLPSWLYYPAIILLAGYLSVLIFSTYLQHSYIRLF